MNSKLLIVSLLALTASGCSTLTDERKNFFNTDKVIKKASKARALAITEGDTLYSNSLRCIDEIFDENNINVRKKLDITVAKIFDKTGSLFPNENSTALSDMTLHALTKMPLYFEVIDSPTSNINDSRINYSSPLNPFRKSLDNSSKRNNRPVSFDISTISDTPVGITHPTTSYINGAIIQYDEASELPKDFRSFGIGIDLLSASREVKVATIGINLRLVDSSTGKVAKNGSIHLTNRLIAIKESAELFKIINNSDRDFGYSVTTADPKHYAVMEMIEKGVYTIFSRLIDSPRQCHPENIHK
uniref:Uncharacterized protein n=1 Tax=uncultured Thiotrichaceae bacterium TaxID=298394 RepID=A0A6S6U0B5_9GAMM|nr:MAG: Unknown protein [uncultured Thiotrichaceae bacterium]